MYTIIIDTLYSYYSLIPILLTFFSMTDYWLLYVLRKYRENSRELDRATREAIWTVVHRLSLSLLTSYYSNWRVRTMYGQRRETICNNLVISAAMVVVNSSSWIRSALIVTSVSDQGRRVSSVLCRHSSSFGSSMFLDLNCRQSSVTAYLSLSIVTVQFCCNLTEDYFCVGWLIDCDCFSSLSLNFRSLIFVYLFVTRLEM